MNLHLILKYYLVANLSEEDYFKKNLINLMGKKLKYYRIKNLLGQFNYNPLFL